jgi:hypothetical protein
MLHDHVLFLCLRVSFAFCPLPHYIETLACGLPASFWFSSILYFTSASTSAYLVTHSSFAQLACRVIMIASFIARLCTRKTKGIHPGRASPPILVFRRLECPTLHHSTISNISSFAQLACRTCTIVGFIARSCSLGNERDSFWESVPSPILSNYSRLRLRPRKIMFSKESFAQLACRVYIIVGFIARFFCSLGNERDSHRESVPSPPPK